MHVGHVYPGAFRGVSANGAFGNGSAKREAHHSGESSTQTAFMFSPTPTAGLDWNQFFDPCTRVVNAVAEQDFDTCGLWLRSHACNTHPMPTIVTHTNSFKRTPPKSGNPTLIVRSQLSLSTSACRRNDRHYNPLSLSSTSQHAPQYDHIICSLWISASRTR